MAWILGNLPIICLGAVVAISVILLVSSRKKSAPQRLKLLEGDQELALLKGQMRQLEERYQTQLEFFVSFPEVVKALTAALTFEQVTSACSRGITALLHTRSIAILLAESDCRLRLTDGTGFPSELRNNFSCGVGEAGLVGVLALRGVSSLSEHPAAQAFLREIALPVELAMPIWHGNHQLGLILVARTIGEPQVTRRTLAMLADLTGVGLDAARQVSQIRDEAENDPLTGLANRRTLLTRITHELQRSLSYHSRTSLAMIDVDHFKHYNDHNGHAAGDAVLRSVARLAASVTRRTDLVARYGGEEFTVVLSGASRDQGFRHAERIRSTIAVHPFEGGKAQPLGIVSISVGLATFPDDAESVESLFEAADQALYRAKNGGRNRVVLYDKAMTSAKSAAGLTQADPSQPSPP
jgi:diguanylate cyclase (GGDEF)-like protein